MTPMTRALTVALTAGLAAPALGQTDIEWIGGSSNWNNIGNWSTANIPNATNENALILMPAFAQVNLDTTVNINALEVGPQLSLVLEAGRGITLSGNLINNGFIDLNPSANINNSFIQFNSNAMISGNGILRLSGGGNDAALSTNATSVTNGVGHTIDGAGQLTASLINNGVVSAIDTGFGNRLELIINTKTNNSTMQAGPNAELFISSITINQGASGVIAANSGGSVIFNVSPTVNGGRILGPGTLVKASSGNLSLSGVSLEDDLEVEESAGILYNSGTFNCTGTITLNDSGSANNSFVQFNANSTISGGGSIFLAGGGAPGASNDSFVTTNATTLTIAPDFTIEGSGELNAAVINNGLVRAFPSANGDGRLRLITNNKTNNGMMLADPGGTLEINGVTIAQGPMGEILADGGIVELVSSQTINGGTIRAINGGMIIKPTSGNVTLSDVLLDADLDVLPSAGVFYNSPSFVCTGSIILNDTNSANNSFVQFNDNATISGGGRIFLAGGGNPGGSNDSFVTTNGTTLTIAPDFTVEGSGELRAATINNGLVRAFPSTNGDGRLRLLTNNKTNNADIRADAGGVIEINSVTVTQDPAGEILADGGAIEFVSSQTVNGGTIRAINAGTLTKTTSGNLSLSDVTIEGRLDVEAAAGIFYNSETLVCTDTIALNDSGSANNAFMQFNANTTAMGGGRIFLGGSSNDSFVTTNGTTLTIAPDFTVEGSGELRAATINNGLVRAFMSEFGDGRLLMNTNGKTNNAQMIADTDAVIEINGVTVSQGPAGEILADGGTIEFKGSQTINGGTLRTDDGGRLRRLASGNLSVSSITLEGDLELEAPSTMFVNSTDLVNNGIIRVNSTGSANNAVVQFNANTMITGTGTVLLEAGIDDSRLATNGTTATLSPTQVLTGEGTMNGSYAIQGRFSPGLPVGKINGAANITFADTTLFVADTSGPGVGDGIDFTSGTIVCDGDVSVRLAYVPAINDQFNIITAGTVNGLFDDVYVSVGSLPTNIAVRLVYTPSTVDVRFVCLADLAPPYGVLDLADVTGFTQGFLSNDPLADLAEPIGVFDLADIGAFVATFLSNCN